MTASEARLVRYLLGRMSEPERAEIEEQLLVEDGFEDDMLATAEDLLQGYLQDALPAEDRRAVETHLLASPYQRRRLEFMQDLLSAAGRAAAGDDRPARAPAAAERGRGAATTRWLAVAAVVTLLVLAGVLWVLDGWHPRSRQALRTPPPGASPSAAGPESPRTSPAVASTVESFTLPDRNEASVDVAVSSAARTLRLIVPVEKPGLVFNVALRTPQGRAVWRAEGVARSAPEGGLVLTVPAEVLAAAADYLLSVRSDRLRGTESAGLIREYRLHLRRPPASPTP
jgi:hypothetical protein